MLYGGYRDGRAQAPPSFNSSGEFGRYFARENLMELQGDGLSYANDGSRIHIGLNECIESEDPCALDSDDGQQ